MCFAFAGSLAPITYDNSFPLMVLRFFLYLTKQEGDLSSESSVTVRSKKLLGIDGKALMQLFPFHIIFGKDMVIRQVGQVTL